MIKKYILNKTFFSKRLVLLQKKENLYRDINTSSEIVHHQLEMFNLMWSKAQKHPFYEFWKLKHSLPTKINTLDELTLFPILTKKDLQEHKELIFGHLTHYKVLSTGGSTGEPTKIPFDGEEVTIHYANAYLGRSWWGIRPLDKLLLVWGHSHLFGSGLRGKINFFKRILSDRIINTYRFSAYNLSQDAIISFLQKMDDFKPKVILGYTSALVQIAKYLASNHLKINNIFLDQIILTSEMAAPSDIALLKKVFDVSIVLEYGMAETGVLAYSHPNDGNLHVLWDSFVLQEKQGQLLVTTLYDRAFPLIGYATGDSGEIRESIQTSILSLETIRGRANDILNIKIGENYILVHSEMFTHILKAIDFVDSFKIIQFKSSKKIIVEYVTTKENLDIKNLFFSEIIKEFPLIDKLQFSFLHVNDIPKTIAGKTKWVEIKDE